MSLKHKPIGSIVQADLIALVTNAEIESRIIEYKRTLPGTSDSAKKEFLADVSSFANAAGGDIVYGMEELGGAPTQLVGLQLDNVDTEKLRLEDIIRSGIAPRIAGISVEVVPLSGTEVAFVIRIPNSFARPHIVTFKSSQRFYSRNSAGKYQLDVSELRSAFLVSATFAERARQFRIDRLARLVAGETPVKLHRPPTAILHLIPATAFDAASSLDISYLLGQGDRLPPMMAAGSYNRPRYNFDGLLASDLSQGAAYSYAQLFRNGIIEATLSDLNDDDELEKKILATNWLEERLIEALPIYLHAQQDVGVQPPIFLMFTLFGVSGYVLRVKDGLRRRRFDQIPIDRDQLNIPELMLEDVTKDSGELLRPVFDAIWNAAAWPRCFNYDQDGKWSVR
jgi:Putative DNA-binding domain